MTVKYKYGLVTGTRDQLQLPMTVWEDGLGTLDRDTALATVEANAPNTVLGCDYTTDIGITERSANAITFAITYKRAGKNTILRKATVQAKSKKLYHFISAGKVYGTSGSDDTADFASLKWKLDRQGSQDEFNAGKPMQVDPYGETRSFSILTTADMLTDKFLDAMEGIFGPGCFNAATMWGKDAKTLQAVTFTANEREQNEWELSFGFAYVPVRTSVDVGDGVQIPTLYGTEWYWPVEKQALVSGTIQPKVIKAVVGQVWDTGDFSLIPQIGTLSTRTSNVAGVISTGTYAHSIVDGTGSDKIDIYWDGGYQQATITGTTTYTVTFGSGTVDNLPTAGTSVIVKKAPA